MSDRISDAGKAFARKRNVPGELITEDWRAVDGWIKERSFYMAGVKDAEILQLFRTEAERMARGESSGSEAMNRLWLALEQKGYQPPAGKEGKIQDLRTVRRMSVTLDTNVAIVRGYGMWARAQKSLRAFPTWKLVRVADRKKKRDWLARGQAAYEKTKHIPGVVLHNGEWHALINHPFWLALSAFGNAYPPYDWGSGMGVTAVSRTVSKAIGLLDDPRTRPMWEKSALQSPNANTELVPDISEPALRDALADRLQGIAKWEGDTLVMTDPNGTRPYTAEALADLWERNLPEYLAHFQRDSVREWIQGKPIQPKSEKWGDLERFLERLRNEREAERLWRETQMERKDIDQLLAKLKGGYQIDPTVAAEQWVEALGKADSGQWSVVFNVGGPARAKDASAILESPAWIYKGGTRFEVLGIEENPATKQVVITLKES